MKLSYVYILKCKDNSFYTGVTSNLEKRFEQHQRGFYKNSYTYLRRPVVLVFFASFTDINIAIDMEKQIKKWSRAKKQAVIDDKFEALPNLAKKKF